MTQEQKLLLEKAKRRHSKILPVLGYRTFDDRSFKTYGLPSGKKHVCFWYNDAAGSTHIVTETAGG